MALGFSVAVTLDVTFDFNVVRSVLNKGSQLGYSYERMVLLGPTADGKGIEVEWLPLTVDAIVTGIESAKKNKDVFPVI